LGVACASALSSPFLTAGFSDQSPVGAAFGSKVDRSADMGMEDGEEEHKLDSIDFGVVEQGDDFQQHFDEKHDEKAENRKFRETNQKIKNNLDEEHENNHHHDTDNNSSDDDRDEPVKPSKRSCPSAEVAWVMIVMTTMIQKRGRGRSWQEEKRWQNCTNCKKHKNNQNWQKN
jgi:hypothetical protein